MPSESSSAPPGRHPHFPHNSVTMPAAFRQMGESYNKNVKKCNMFDFIIDMIADIAEIFVDLWVNRLAFSDGLYTARFKQSQSKTKRASSSTNRTFRQSVDQQVQSNQSKKMSVSDMIKATCIEGTRARFRFAGEDNPNLPERRGCLPCLVRL